MYSDPCVGVAFRQGRVSVHASRQLGARASYPIFVRVLDYLVFLEQLEVPPPAQTVVCMHFDCLECRWECTTHASYPCVGTCLP